MIETDPELIKYDTVALSISIGDEPQSARVVLPLRAFPAPLRAFPAPRLCALQTTRRWAFPTTRTRPAQRALSAAVAVMAMIFPPRTSAHGGLAPEACAPGPAG